MRLPHPIVLLLSGTVLAAVLTWVLPAGEFERRRDEATGRSVAVAGTYHRVSASPVGPFAAAVAIPRGFVEAADVVAVIVFVGGAWLLVDRLCALAAVVAALVAAFRHRGLWAIPIIASFFALMGALVNMQEEIIPLIPGLLLLGVGLGIDSVTVVAMSAGAAMVGSAYGPTNPFQAGIALKLAQVPPLQGGLLRLGMLVVASVAWIAFTMRCASRNRTPVPERLARAAAPFDSRHALVLASLLVPMAVYVFGAVRLDWGLNELSAAFFVGALSAGLIGGLGLTGSLTTYLEGMQKLLPSAFMVGLARSISLVLE